MTTNIIPDLVMFRRPGRNLPGCFILVPEFQKCLFPGSTNTQPVFFE